MDRKLELLICNVNKLISANYIKCEKTGNLIWHCYDKPAMYYETKVFGSHENAWVLFGKLVEEDEYKSWLIENGIEIHKLTDEDKVLIRMKYG